jgi:hypothetical protein
MLSLEVLIGVCVDQDCAFAQCFDLVVVAPEVIEQIGATTASDIWWVPRNQSGFLI